MSSPQEAVHCRSNQVTTEYPQNLGATFAAQSNTAIQQQQGEKPQDRQSSNESKDKNTDNTNELNLLQKENYSITPAPNNSSKDSGDDSTKSDTTNEDETKLVSCPHCDQKFTRSHNLKSHLLIHTQTKLFHCSICSTKFRRLHDLKRHEKLHTGEKPFECQKCSRKFARADALVRHSNSQTGCTLLMEGLSSRRSSVSSTNTISITNQSYAKGSRYETNQWKVDSFEKQEASKMNGTQKIENSSMLPLTPITNNENSMNNSKSDFQSMSGTPFQMNGKENICHQTNDNVPTGAPLRDINSEIFKYIDALEQRVFLLESKVNQLTQLQSLQYQTQNIQRNLQGNIHRNLNSRLSNVDFNMPPNISSTSMGFIPSVMKGGPLKPIPSQHSSNQF